MAISEESDQWADKLGHANFHIRPEPYLPEVSTLLTSKRLLEDWATARAEFTRQARHIEEHYGPTSNIYMLAQQKWSEIDALWRKHDERVRAEAEANGEAGAYQRTLAETNLSAYEMPVLSDPDKFPKTDEIVGPMVKYDLVESLKGLPRRSSSAKKPTLLKLFTDPASLLGLMRR
jgi:hypothetical protein